MDLNSAFIDTNLNKKQGAYLRLSRVAENHSFDKQTRYEASLVLLEKAINDENLE